MASLRHEPVGVIEESLPPKVVYLQSFGLHPTRELGLALASQPRQQRPSEEGDRGVVVVVGDGAFQLGEICARRPAEPTFLTMLGRLDLGSPPQPSRSAEELADVEPGVAAFVCRPEQARQALPGYPIPVVGEVR